MPAAASAGAHDRHADAGVTPEQLLDGDRQREPGRVAHRVHQEVDAVEADLGGLLDDRPRELLALVPLVGGRADDALGEVVDPLLDLQLVFVEGRGRSRPWTPSYHAGNIACLPAGNLSRHRCEAGQTAHVRRASRRRGDGVVDQLGARLVDVHAVPAHADVGGDRLVVAPLVGTLDERHRSPALAAATARNSSLTWATRASSPRSGSGGTPAPSTLHRAHARHLEQRRPGPGAGERVDAGLQVGRARSRPTPACRTPARSPSPVSRSNTSHAPSTTRATSASARRPPRPTSPAQPGAHGEGVVEAGRGRCARDRSRRRCSRRASRR